MCSYRPKVDVMGVFCVEKDRNKNFFKILKSFFGKRVKKSAMGSERVNPPLNIDN